MIADHVLKHTRTGVGLRVEHRLPGYQVTNTTCDYLLADDPVVAVNSIKNLTVGDPGFQHDFVPDLYAMHVRRSGLGAGIRSVTRNRHRVELFNAAQDSREFDNVATYAAVASNDEDDVQLYYSAQAETWIESYLMVDT